MPPWEMTTNERRPKADLCINLLRHEAGLQAQQVIKPGRVGVSPCSVPTGTQEMGGVARHPVLSGPRRRFGVCL